MKVNRQNLKWYIDNIKYNYPNSTPEEFADHLANYIEMNPGCIDMYGIARTGRFSYSTVGYGVFSLFGEKYRMGRIEIFDDQDESGYAVSEGSYSIPHGAAKQFEDFIESIETDLPIHIEIGNHEWCDTECAKVLGVDPDKMNDMETKKAFYSTKNDAYARDKGFKDWDDLLANSKFAKKKNEK